MSLQFNFAQTFLLDKSLVDGASEVALTKVDLYFWAKPAATGNKSGIKNPGVEVMILPCRNGVPVVNQIGAYRPTEPTEHGAKFAFYSGGQVARVEYDEIRASADGSIPTEFLLPSPAFVRTNQEYAIVIKFDGNETFRLHQAKVGDLYRGTKKVFPGPTSRFIGNLFSFIRTDSRAIGSGYGYSNTAVAANTSGSSALLYTSSQNLGITADDGTEVGAWSPIPGVDIKFKVYAARYAKNGVPLVSDPNVTANNLITTAADRAYVFNLPESVVSNNVIQLHTQVEPQEYVLFDRSQSVRKELMYGETVFQWQPSFPGGAASPLTFTVSPTANVHAQVNFTGVANVDYYKSTLAFANGSYAFANGKTLSQVGLQSLFVEGQGLVFKDANNDHEVRFIQAFLSNTIMKMDSAFTVPKTNVQMFVAPIAYIGDISPSYLYGQNRDMMVLYDSTADIDCRFTSKSMANVSVNAGGSGYSNSDYLLINGFERVANVVEGNYAATANLTTNSTGGITGVRLSNVGAGFVDATWLTGANVVVKTSASGVPSNTNSSGTGATFNFDIGSRLLSEFSESMFANTEVINLDAVRMKPEITVNNPVGTAFTIKHRTLFYKKKDDRAVSGFAYHVNTPAEQKATDTYSKIFKSHSLITSEDRVPVIPSRSNQFVTRFANGTSANTETIGELYSNSAIFLFEISSNNDFQATYFDPEIINSHYSNYIINREYTNEHTNFGKAWARHLSTKINLKEGRSAEDLLVYIAGYRPAGADFKVYAKLHNSHDTEEFDDKDWTLLEQIDGVGVYSSKDDSSDYVELTYNLPGYPNSEFTMFGSAAVQSGNATVTGTNTVFSALFLINNGGTGFANGDFVYAEPPVEAVPENGIYALGPSKRAEGVLTTNSTGGITSILVTDSGAGFISQANVTDISFANSTGGTSAGSTANVVYRPGVIANDLVKIYSPYFPATNYTVAVIESAANNSFVIKRNFGDLEANGAGSVSVNTTSANVVGTGTSFMTTFTPGAFLAVWANSTSYEVRKVASVSNNTLMTIDSSPAFSITGSGLNYATVETDAFANGSIAVTDLLVDKLYYPLQAYNNIQNANVARYHSESRAVFDNFDTFQVKVVMVSEDDINVPKMDTLTGVAVSA